MVWSNETKYQAQLLAKSQGYQAITIQKQNLIKSDSNKILFEIENRNRIQNQGKPDEFTPFNKTRIKHTQNPRTRVLNEHLVLN